MKPLTTDGEVCRVCRGKLGLKYYAIMVRTETVSADLEWISPVDYTAEPVARGCCRKCGKILKAFYAAGLDPVFQPFERYARCGICRAQVDRMKPYFVMLYNIYNDDISTGSIIHYTLHEDEIAVFCPDCQRPSTGAETTADIDIEDTEATAV